MQSNKTKTIIKSVAIITVFAVITRFLGFLFRIYLTRKIGAEELGYYQVSFSILAVFLAIVTTGLPLTISKLTARYQSQKNYKQNSKMLTSSLIFTLCLAVSLCTLAVCIRPLWVLMFKSDICSSVLLLLLPALLFSAIYSVFRGHLWGKNNFFGVCVTELIEQIARFIVCVLIFILFPMLSGGMVAGLSLSVACFVSLAVCVIIFFCTGGRLASPDKSYKEVIKTSAPITGVRLVATLSVPLISTILPLRLIALGYTKAQAMSLLGIATGMTLPLLFVPITLVGSLSMALIPELSYAKTQKLENQISSRVKNSITFSLFVSVFLLPLFMATGEGVGEFFFSNQFSGTLLAHSAWIMVPMGLANISSAILNGLSHEKVSFISTIIGTLVMAITIFFFPMFAGINSLFLSLGLSFTISATTNLIYIRYKLKIKFHIIKPLSAMLLLSIPTTAITGFCFGILSHFFTSFFTLAVSCSIGFTFFVVSLSLFKVIEPKLLLSKFKLFNQKKSRPIKDLHKN